MYNSKWQSVAIKTVCGLCHAVNTFLKYYSILNQHILLSVGGLMSIPLLLAPLLCLGDDSVGNEARAYLICSIFFVSGIVTLLQSTVGNRYIAGAQDARFKILRSTGLSTTFANPKNSSWVVSHREYFQFDRDRVWCINPYQSWKYLR